MRKIAASLTILAFLLITGIRSSAQQANPPAATPPAPQMKLMISPFSDGGDIPVKYTCAAKPAGVSPAIQWTGAPQGTASFTLIMHDPDAHPNKGMSDVTHWILWNIPGTATQLPEAVAANTKLEDGTVQGKNIAGANAYRPPCPPAGKPHHYTFELYALDQKVDLAPDAARADVLKAMDGHIIAKAVYIGYFHQ